MRFLEEQDSKILGIIADSPAKYAYLVEQLSTEEARKIGEALVHRDESAEAVREAFGWANQSRVRPIPAT